MLDFAKTTLNQTAGHPLVLTATLLYSARVSFHETSGHPLILWMLALLAFLHAITTSFFPAFKRDANKKTFSTVYDAASLLSNPDSILDRDGVNHSIITYETLFAGARQETGISSTRDSIQRRAIEYQTMVNSFYNLVTDFYEWGWGQVSAIYVRSTQRMLDLELPNYVFFLVFTPSHFILRPERMAKLSTNQLYELSTM